MQVFAIFSIITQPLIFPAYTVLCNAIYCDKCFRIPNKTQCISYTSQLGNFCKLSLPQP